ncbi:hypothetical protein Patl1_16128 [Pistacia atlantica]|uniref:Uncharacterized protein n=1 Tax=Pistacia atlantica TaxID=434234 RepID=A0ACC1B6L3_9ROSI|nr:hypothetical protein Patl1_16128 [Pistacia atlantica]
MARVNNNQEQVSIPIDYDEIADVNSLSDDANSASNPFGFLTNNGMIKIEEESWWHIFVKNSFLFGMGQLAIDTRIVAIHKNSNCGLTGKARLTSFTIFYDAVAKKCGGNANIVQAWYGASRDEINEIVRHGFSPCSKDSSYGGAVQLFPLRLSLSSALTTEMDENGLRHVLLCRVILGKMEEIASGSKQIHPSSMEFDSGVDNIVGPTKYIVWSCYMNSHIHLDYIVSFKVSSSEGVVRPQGNAIRPSSRDRAIQHNGEITFKQFIQNLKQVAGDKFLFAVFKLYKHEVWIVESFL